MILIQYIDIELLTDTNKLLNDVGLVDFSSKSAKKVGSIEELRTVSNEKK